MKTLARSWHLTRVTFGVILREPSLLLLPALAVIGSMALVVAVVWPVSSFDPGTDESRRTIWYATAFFLYFGLAFVATFFNTCVVHTAHARFQCQDPTLGESLRFAGSRVGAILGWSLVAATVGIVFKALEALADRTPGVGRLILYVIHAIFGITWSVVSLLVVPAMVCRDIGPIDAMRHATRALERTFGEGIVLEIGLGAIQILLAILGIAAFVALFRFGAGSFWPLLAGAVVYLVVLGSVFSLAGTIYGTALFLFADTGELPPGYDDDLLRGAVAARR